MAFHQKLLKNYHRQNIKKNVTRAFVEISSVVTDQFLTKEKLLKISNEFLTKLYVGINFQRIPK